MRLTRKPDRGVDDRAALDAFLDEQLSGVLATVHEGRPHVIPIAYARDCSSTARRAPGRFGWRPTVRRSVSACMRWTRSG